MIPYRFNPLGGAQEGAWMEPVAGIRGAYLYVGSQAISSAMVVSGAVLLAQSANIMRIWKGGIASATVVNQNASAIVDIGGIMVDAVINSRGTVSATLAEMTGIKINSMGGCYVSGGQISDTDIRMGGFMYCRRADIIGITVSDGGTISAVSSSTISGALILPGGKIEFSGSGENIEIGSGVRLALSSETICSRVTVLSGASHIIGTGAQSVDMCISSGGILIITELVGTDSATVVAGVNERGTFYISSGSSFNYIIHGTQQIVSWGGIAESGTIFSGGTQTVVNGGRTMDSLILAGGLQIVSSAGYSERLDVLSGGKVTVNYGGIVSCAVIDSGGSLTVLSGGTAYAVTSVGGAMIQSNLGAVIEIIEETAETKYDYNKQSEMYRGEMCDSRL